MNTDTSVQRLPRQQLQVHSFEDFKTNCLLLENALSTENLDPTQDLRKLSTWIRWIEKGHGSNQHEEHFYRFALPRITRSLLERRYPDDNIPVLEINDFFQNVLSIIAAKLDEDWVELTDTLANLFKPDARFYTLFGHESPAPDLSALIGSEIELRVSSGKVFKAILLEESLTRPEVKVQLLERPQTTWVPTSIVVFPHEKHQDEWSQGSSTKKEKVADNRTTIGDVTAHEIGSPSWRQELNPGSLVDVRDGANEWFLAFIVDKRMRQTSFDESLHNTNAYGPQPRPAKVSSEEEVFVVTFGRNRDYDEWIPVSSERLAAAKTRSGGRRGHGLARLDIDEPVVDDDDKPEAVVVYRKQERVSLWLVRNVNYFAQIEGFTSILDRLKENAETVSLPIMHSLVVAMANISRILSKRMAQEVLSTFVEAIRARFELMTDKEVRYLTKELALSTLDHLEHLQLRLHDWTIAASIPEELLLRLCRLALFSKSLELRLNGLRLVHEIGTRVTNSKFYPRGFKVESTASGKYVIERVPVTKAISAQRFCAWLNEHHILRTIFVGPLAHEQLMRRSPDILRFLAGENSLTEEIMEVLWEASQGSQEHRSTAFYVLEEIVGNLNQDLAHKLVLKLRSLAPSSHSMDTLNLVYAFAMCHLEATVPAWSYINEGWYGGSGYHQQLVQDSTLETVDLLWMLSQDSTLVSESLGVESLQKLKLVLEGVYGAHLRRRYMEMALESIKNHHSVPQALEIVSGCVNMFTRTRADVVSWLRNQNLLPPFFADLIHFKEEVHLYLQRKNKTDLIVHPLTDGKSAEFNQQVLPFFRSQGCRFTYFYQIRCRVEFLKSLLRADKKLSFSQNEISVLWDNLNLKAFTLEEQNYIITFFSDAVEARKIASLSRNNGTSSISEARSPMEIDSADPSVIFMEDTYNYIFRELLSSHDYLTGPDLTVSAFHCLQKFFRLINHEKGHILERMGSTRSFHVLSFDKQIEGLEDFWTIALAARELPVALEAIRFLTTLYQQAGSGSSSNVRLAKVQKCLGHLREAVEEFDEEAKSHESMALQTFAGVKPEERIRRCLLVLRNFISADDAYTEALTNKVLFRHSSLYKGKRVTLPLNNSVKGSRTKGQRTAIEAYEMDTAWQLQATIARLVGVPPNDLRIFRAGKEIQESARFLTLQQLGIKDGDAILVSMSQSVQPTPEVTPSPTITSDDTSGRISIEELPPVVICKHSTNFDLLFRLLSERHSDVVSKNAWEILMGLPTNPEIQARIEHGTSEIWADLLSFSEVHGPRLLYVLQVIWSLLSGERRAQKLDWSGHFVVSGGLGLLMKILMTKSDGLLEKPESHFVTELRLDCLALVIRIVAIVLGERLVSGARSNALETYGQIMRRLILNVQDRTIQEDEELRDVGSACQTRGGPSCLSTLFPHLSPLVLQDQLLGILQSGFSLGLSCPIQGKERNLAKKSEDIVVAGLCLWANCCLDTPSILLRLKEERAFQSLLFDFIQCQYSPRIRACFSWCIQSITSRKHLSHVEGGEAVADAVVDHLVTTLLANLPPPKGAAASLISPDFFLLLYFLIERLYEKAKPTQSNLTDEDRSVLGSFSWSKDLLVNIMRWLEGHETLERGFARTVTPGRQVMVDLPGDSATVQWEGDLHTSKTDEAKMELADSGDEDIVLIGFLMIIRLLLRLYPDLKRLASANEGKESLLQILWNHCLFDISGRLRDINGSAVPGLPPKCKTPLARTQAYRLVEELVQSTPENLYELLPSLEKQHSAFTSDDSESVFWGHDPSKEQRSPTGFVGLVNSGCVCYMNSLLQQLYMIPSLRSGLLTVRGLHRHKVGKLSATRDPENEPMRSATPEPIDPNSDEYKLRLLAQLQQMFGYLLLSERQAYDPEPWLQVCVDEDGHPINISIQQDAQEFFTTCCDRLHDAVEKTERKGLIKQTLSGTLSTQLLCQGGCNRGRETAQEHFVSMTVEVKGQKDLQSSLKHLTQGEVLDGVNCDHCGDRKPTLKRDCIGTLPDTLFIHLKRFELNFDTFNREKVNDRFEFPLELNLWPYTREGLELLQLHGTTEKVPVGADTDLFPLGLPYPRSYYEYSLVGVVVHSGSAESGHYYSFIKHRGGNKGASAGEDEWFEFNDSVIKPFSLDRLEEECFGGQITAPIEPETASPMNPKARAFQRSRNAYMLVYERNNPSRATSVEPQSAIISKRVEDPGLKKEGDLSAEPVVDLAAFGEGLQISRHVCEDVWADNVKYIHSRLLFSEEHAHFMVDIFREAMPANRHDYPPRELWKTADRSVLMDPPFRLLRLGATFLLEVLAKSGHGQLTLQMIKELKRLYERNTPAAVYLLLDCIDDMHPILELLVRCPNAAIRMGFAEFLLALVQVLLQYESDSLLVKSHLASDTGEGISLDEMVDDVSAKPNSIVIGLFDALLSTATINEVAANWRNQTEYYWLFHRFACLSERTAAYLLDRKVVMLFADQILGELSPLIGPVFQPASRKRVPAVGVGTPLQYRPNWYYCLCTISRLVRFCVTSPRMGEEVSVRPPTLLYPEAKSHPTLDRWSQSCILSKSLYINALSYPGAWMPVIEIMSHWCYEWQAFSESVIELFEEHVALGRIEFLDVLFSLLGALLNIRDSIAELRLQRVLWGCKGEGLPKSISAFEETSPAYALGLAAKFCLLFRQNDDLAERFRQVKDGEKVLQWLRRLLSSLVDDERIDKSPYLSKQAPTSVSVGAGDSELPQLSTYSVSSLRELAGEAIRAADHLLLRVNGDPSAT